MGKTIPCPDTKKYHKYPKTLCLFDIDMKNAPCMENKNDSLPIENGKW
jgi:hypothetical protein